MGGYTYHFVTTALDCRTANVAAGLATRLVLMFYDTGSGRPARANHGALAPLWP